MSCDNYKQDLSAYVDGELDAAPRADLEEHIAECKDCREELQKLRKLTAVLQGTPRAKAPPSLARRIADAAKSEHEPKILRIRRWVPLIATAAVIMLAAVIGFSARRESETYRAYDSSEAPATPAASAKPDRESKKAAEKTGAPESATLKDELLVTDSIRLAKKGAPAKGLARARTSGAPQAFRAPRPTTMSPMANGGSAPPPLAEEAHEETIVGKRMDGPAQSAAPTVDDVTAPLEGATAQAKMPQKPAAAASPARHRRSKTKHSTGRFEKEIEEPVLLVEVQVTNRATERARVVDIAHRVGGGIVVPNIATNAAPDAPGRPADTTVEVRVPSTRTAEFLAEVEKPALDRASDKDSKERDANAVALAEPGAAVGEFQSELPENSGWTRVRVAINTPIAAVAKAEGGIRDAADVEARMNALLNTQEKSAKISSARKLRGGRIEPVMRFHLIPFRGDVTGEVGRVKKLARHHGGREIGGTDIEPRQQIRPVGTKRGGPVELRFALPLAAVPEFMKDSRLGIPPREADAAGGRGAPLGRPLPKADRQTTQQPQRWVTVIVTVGPTDPAKARQGDR
jgi:hypothetical protein